MWYLIGSIPDLCTLTYFDLGPTVLFAKITSKQTDMVNMDLVKTFDKIPHGGGGGLLSKLISMG